MDYLANHPALAPLRGKDAIDAWVTLFARRDPERARRYQDAIAVFLGTADPKAGWAGRVPGRSPNTQRAYAYALSEFFEFLQVWRGSIVPPHEVTRKDAADYVEWLSTRGRHPVLQSQWNFSIRAEKLKDGDAEELEAVYTTVRNLGSAKLGQIVRALPPKLREKHRYVRVLNADGSPGYENPWQARYDVDLTWMVRTLRQLLVLRVLRRSPTLKELRKKDPGAGIYEPIDPEIYTYQAPEIRPVAQATIAQRVAALSSFWKILQRGENTTGEALLKYNVFDEVKSQVNRGLRRQARERKKEKLIPPAIMRRLLKAAHGQGSLIDLRNASLLWFLLLTGARLEEALELRRGTPRTEAERLQWPGWINLDSTPPTVMLLRKGGLRQQIIMPATAIRVIRSFWEKLEETAQTVQFDRPYRKLAEEPDAPLFPPLYYWGSNGDLLSTADYRKSMSASNVWQLLKELADRAELTPDERRRVHPHAFRHAAAGGMATQGKNLREIQHLLNHATITTTEGYLPAEDDLERLTGEAEIISWLSEGTALPEAIRTDVPRQQRPEPIETVSEPVEETTALAKPEPRAIEATFEDTNELPIGPPLPPFPNTLLALAAPDAIAGGIMEIGPEYEGETSNPWPTESYRLLAAQLKPKDIAWSGVPQSRFVADWYESLPRRFGIGKESLLLWHNPQAPLPLPVLSPGQAYPEIEVEGNLLAALELLYDDWQQTKPTATLALAKWLQYLGSQTVGLEAALRGDYEWSPFDGPAVVGTSVREHDVAWLVEWFKTNAHTFTVAQRTFESPQFALGEAGETAEEFWQRMRTEISIVPASPVIPELPEYFAERDPVHAIYERDPGEWAAFARWLRRLLGSSDLRVQNRDEQEGTEDIRKRAERKQAEALLVYYFELVDEVKQFPNDPGPAESMPLVAEQLLNFFQIRVPKSADDRNRSARIQGLLDKRWPEYAAPPVPTGSVLGDSRLFQPDLLEIDEAQHTIVHRPDVRSQFAREHDGRDSECVMRRVARALWEHVREWEYAPAQTGAAKRRRASRSELRKQLFVIQLAVMSYIVPCEPELERMLDIHAERPTEVTRRLNDEIRRAALGEPAEEGGEASDVAFDVAFAFYKDLPEVDPMAALELALQEKREAAFYARAQTAEDLEREAAAERERKRKARERYRVNARALLPHPLRLVAATYWPV